MFRRDVLSLLGGSFLYPSLVFGQTNKWDAHYDVVVIGSGFAGLAAAIEARRNKSTVLLIEKMDAFGGNSAICAGDMAVPDSPVQHKCGIFGDSAAIMLADLQRSGKQIDLAHARAVCQNALSTWRWTTEELGVSWIMDRVQGDLGQSFPRGIMLQEQRSGSVIVQAGLDAAERLKVELQASTKLEKILLDSSGRISGVEVSSGYLFPKENSGTLNRIRARNGVVIATGGFSADVAFRSGLDPRLDRRLSTSNQPGATAEALQEAMRIGAAATDLDKIQVMSWNSREEIFLGQSWAYIEYVTLPFGMWISDNTGEKVCEPGTPHGTRSEILLKASNRDENVIAIVPSSVCEKTGFDLNEVGSLIKQGIIHRYSSASRLASDLDIPVRPMLEEIEKHYQGKQREDQVWYAILLAPKVHHCMGGLSIDGIGRVRRAGDEGFIAGLYAAGEVTGGMFGHARLPSHSSTDALTMGRIAGKSAAFAV